MGAIFKEGFSFSGYERDLLVLNRRDGTFLDVSGCSGVDSISDGRGAAFADLDNDGDLDIVLTTAQGEARFLFRNNVGQDAAWLRIDLEGTDAGRDAYGAVVRVKTAAGIQTKLKAGGAGFLSHHDDRLLFGLGGAARAEWVEIAWPGGARQRLEQVPARTAIRVVEGRDGYETLTERRVALPDPLPAADAFLSRLGVSLGQTLPDFRVTTLDGREDTLSGVVKPGRRTLVNVWATWCVPCAEEMPELETRFAALTAAGVDLVGLSVDLDTAEFVPGYVRSKGVTYPIVTTEEATLDALYPTGEAAVPLTILVDDSLTVLDILPGWSARTERALDILAGRPKTR